MFERKTYTIYPIRMARRPVYIRAESATDAIHAYAELAGLVALNLKDKADSGDIAYVDFMLGTGEAFYCYQTQPHELADLGVAP